MKNYDGDVRDLDLDFTVVNNELGEAQVVDLKPGGCDIPVDSTNRIEYIHLMADYRLNKQVTSLLTANRSKVLIASCDNVTLFRRFTTVDIWSTVLGVFMMILVLFSWDRGS